MKLRDRQMKRKDVANDTESLLKLISMTFALGTRGQPTAYTATFKSENQLIRSCLYLAHHVLQYSEIQQRYYTLLFLL